MRYAHGHKTVTRQRILQAAGQAFRERGLAVTGVQEVMRRAGLTHGGFYAHFRDKTELVVEACSAAFEEGAENLARIGALPTRRDRVRALVWSYLSPRHRDNPAGGCLVASLGLEAARSGGEARAGYSRALQCHRERLEAALRLADDAADNKRLVTALLSQLIGALILARSVADEAASDEVLTQARHAAMEQFGKLD